MTSTNELLKQSILTIRELRLELDKARRKDQEEPIAIVGMACRFPGGANNPERYWNVVRDGVDTLMAVPGERWDVERSFAPPPGKPGRSYIRAAHFLTEDVAAFDAGFFQMAPVECRSTDPQHRLLLETTWESLEDAGVNPLSLGGSSTGVYLGISSHSEYGSLIESSADLDQYVSTGVISSVAAGRISYTFGLNGPAIAVDTACSSSLVAVKLAMDGLRQRDCDVALAAGSSLMLSESVMVSLCAMNALSPEGRSKPFAATADGYGRGEGCAVVVLKRLDTALADGDRVWGVLRGAAVNNDGESSGLTVPNAHAQRAVLVKALESAGVAAHEVDLVETHGTGTLLGDPIEMGAIKDVYGNRDTPLHLGAAKANVGHLECAAGMAGLLKSVLQVHHHQYVPVAGLSELNPRIGADPAIEVQQVLAPWPSPTGQPRRAGVSAFGFSGTNAHVVVEEAPQVEASGPTVELDPVITLSAKTATALVELARAYRDFFAAHPDVDLQGVCDQANRGRALFEHRLLVMPASAADAVEALAEFCAWAEGREDLYAGGVQILGTSHGRDRYAARRRLYQSLANGRIMLAHADDQIEPKFLLALSDEGRPPADRLPAWLALPAYADAHRRVVTMLPSDGQRGDTFAHGYALGAMLAELGIVPDLVTGSGEGALAAAVVSGLVSLDDAVRFLVGRQQAPVPQLHSPRVRYLSWTTSRVPRALDEAWQAVCDDLAGKPSDGNFAGAYDSGYRFIVLDGPREASSGREDVVLLRPSSPTGDPDISRLLAQATALGATVRWPRGAAPLAREVQLPTYPFQRSWYWLDGRKSQPQTMLGQREFGLDAARLDLPATPLRVLHTLTAENFPEAADNSGVIHLGYLVEMLARAAAPVLEGGHLVVRWMDLLRAIIVPAGDPLEVLLGFDDSFPRGGFTIHTRLAGTSTWALAARGEIDVAEGPHPRLALRRLEQDSVQLTQEDFYRPLESERGFYFGPAVRAVDRAIRRDAEAVLELGLGEGVPRRSAYQLGFHPGFVDACAQACNRLSDGQTPPTEKYMVQRLEDVAVWGPTMLDPLDGPRRADVRLVEFDERKETISGSFEVATVSGEVQLSVGSVRLKAFDEEKLVRLASEGPRDDRQGVDHALLARFQRASQAGKVDLILELLTRLMVEILELEPQQVQPTRPMADYGLDSMTGMSMYTRISDLTGCTLTFTDLLDARDLECLAQDITNAMQRNPHEAIGEEVVNLSVDHWLRGYSAKPDQARVRLLCFPNGYRSADMFDEWQDILGPEIQVVGVKLPGMDQTRLRERPPVYVDEFSEQLESVISEELSDLPVATFGHSWGSLYSYRLAARLASTASLRVVHTFVSGFTSPDRPNAATMKVLKELQREGFDRIPEYHEVAGDPQRLAPVIAAFVKTWGYTEMETRSTLPQLLAACCLIDRYHHVPGDQLQVPMTVFHGVDDYGVSLDDSRAWSALGCAGVELHVMAGDHQFVNSEQSERRVLQQIRADLLESLSRGATGSDLQEGEQA